MLRLANMVIPKLCACGCHCSARQNRLHSLAGHGQAVGRKLAISIFDRSRRLMKRRLGQEMFSPSGVYLLGLFLMLLFRQRTKYCHHVTCK